MPIASIVILNNPVLTRPAKFQQVLISGGEESWKKNSYQHVSRAMGGFWSARFTLEADKLGKMNLEDYLINGLMRDVSAYGPDGDLAFSGYINKLVYKTSGVTATNTLEDMANKVWARYLTATDGLPRQTTPAENTESQGLFGVKEKVLLGGVIPTAANATQAATVYLDEYSNPRPRIQINQEREATRSSGISLEVHCKGYIQSLAWRRYNQVATTGQQNASAQITDIINGVSQFVQLGDITTNTTQVSRVYDMDLSALDAIFGITRMSDTSNNRYIAGVYQDRNLVYEQGLDISTDQNLIKYGFRISGNELLISELSSGRIVDPALVRPNDWLRVEDIFPMSFPKESSFAQDPQVTYLENLTYSEPFGLRISGTRATTVDSLMGTSGAAGASLI